MLVHIRKSKGNKDRAVMLSPVLLGDLRNYFKAYNPKVYLFEGQSGGMYSEKSVQTVVKAANKSEYQKTVTPISYGTALPPTFSKMERILGTSSNYWGIVLSRQLKYILT